MGPTLRFCLLLTILISCGGKEPTGPPVSGLEEADTDTDTDADTDTDTDTDEDQDGDGFTKEEGDCDDGDSDVNPDAEELCNGLDDDCDGELDEDDAADATTWYTDGDGDGYGDDTTAVVACDAPAGTVAQGGDCSDTRGSVNPGAEESCNDMDDDCDGEVDEDDAVDAEVWYVDEDGDGYGVDETGVPACDGPSGTVNQGGDCADDDIRVHPEQDDTCDGIDNDCDARVDEDVAEDWFAVSASWEEIDVIEGGYPIWIGVHPVDGSVWAVTRAPSGVGGELGPAFFMYEEGTGFVRQDSFVPEGQGVDVRAATFDDDGMIWVTGRLETTPGDSSTSQVLLLRFDPDTLALDELHHDDDLSTLEYALGIAVDGDNIWLAGRRRNILGQDRAGLWLHDGTETTLIDSEGHDSVLDSHAGYTSVTVDGAGLVYAGGQLEDGGGVAYAVVRGGVDGELEDIFSYATSGTDDLNDTVRNVTTDGDGVLWFTEYHQSIEGFDSPMSNDWRVYTGPPEGPFEVVDTFGFTETMPSFARSLAVHPSGVLFVTGVAMDTEGGTHLIVRAGHPPDLMFTSLDDMRDAVLTEPNQGTYARQPAFDVDGAVWVIEGWLDGAATTDEGEESYNTRIWRMACL